MDQDIYFPRWPAIEHIQQAYHISSLLVTAGIILFGVIFMIACVSLYKIFFHVRAYRKSVAYQKEKHIKEILDKPPHS